jgi:hypothetical protein
MGILSTAAKAAGAIFGAGSDPDAQERVYKAVRGVGNWIDEQQLTDQEKQQAHAELIASYGKFVENSIAENTLRSQTRRNLAIWIIRLEAFFLLLTAALWRLDNDTAQIAWKIATESIWGLLTLGVGAFFFGTHMLRSTKWNKE